ncbi:MAG TPA: 7-cyano-7-deazaguanine synthase QueC [Planctomycetota bacterium]|nr:7-cyano-7-deazaguanine synthase QueC [Planctomycetota bacterium]
MTKSTRPIAVCLLSGGMDSAVALAHARRDGFEPCALSFRYGQRHVIELDAASRVARAQGCSAHKIVTIDLREIGGSALTDDIAVPADRDVARTPSSVPVTYVPARNTVFLAVALGWAEVLGARDIYLGVNAVDYSGYPDCRPEFLAAFEQLAAVATAAGTERGARFKVHAPLLSMDKREIVLSAEELGVDLGLTHTCYDPLVEASGTSACGRCEACRLRLKGFAEAGRRDPLRYANVGPEER